MDFLSSYTDIWLILHLFAMVLGLGGATYTDILLVRFLKDSQISRKEAGIIRQMSRVILVGICLATVSGWFLFYPQANELMNSVKFVSKVVIFLVLVVNGFLLHQLVLPKLVKFSFHKDHYITDSLHLRHFGFVMGAISFVSWYSVFILGALDSVPYPLEYVLGAYFSLLTVAVITSLILEWFLTKRIQQN